MAHKTTGRCRSGSTAVYPLHIFHACANAHLPVRHARQVPSATTHALWQILSGHTRWLLCIHKKASLVYTHFRRLRLVYTHFRRLRAELCIHNARVVYAQSVDWLHSVYTSCACTNMLHMCIHISVDFALSCAYTMRELCMHRAVALCIHKPPGVARCACNLPAGDDLLTHGSHWGPLAARYTYN